MKRLIASALSLSLVLGTGASAQTVRVAVEAGASAAPVPLTGTVAPALSLSAPVLSAPSLSLMPALAAPAIMTAYGGLQPSAAVPALAASPLSAAKNAAPSIGEAGSGVSFVPHAAPIESLKAAALPETGGALVFDGGRVLSAAAETDPPKAPDAAGSPQKKGWLARYAENRKKPSGPAGMLGKAMIVTAMATTAIPPLLKMAPALKMAYALAFASAATFIIVVPVGIALWTVNKLRRAPQTAAKPPPRRAKTALLALGVALGIGIGALPYQVTGPVVERASAIMDARRPAAERDHARWISGGAVQDETIKVLSANPVGRDTLDALRDRFGVVRLPPFFLSHQKDSYAEHESYFDGLYLNEDEVTSRGWTIEQFLKDPALQRRLIREMDSTVLHELTHAVQGRRPPWTPGYLSKTFESEQEAFFQEMLYRFAELEQNPQARNNGYDQWMIIDAADGIDGFLKEVAAMYPDNKAIGRDPYFNAYIAAQRARWPAFRVHIYQVLAARAPGEGSAKMYMERAKAAAKEAGLPEPAPLTAGQ